MIQPLSAVTKAENFQPAGNFCSTVKMTKFHGDSAVGIEHNLTGPPRRCSTADFHFCHSGDHLDMGCARRIKDAIEHNQFTLDAQPAVDTRSKQMPGYEVLLRLRDEHGELIMPNGFLPSAERFGLATQVDR